MKKFLSAIIFALLIVSALSFTTVAADDFVGKKEFTIASYNGVKAFVSGSRIEELEDSLYWLAGNKETYNVKYVSFLGKIANECPVSYAQVVTGQGKSGSEFDKKLRNIGYEGIFEILLIVILIKCEEIEVVWIFG
jgi:hypothetical protein